MLIEKLLFNVVAFSLFVFMFFKLIRKNDTTYVAILIIEAIGILLNFIEIIAGLSAIWIYKIIMYTFAILIPIVVLIIEAKGVNFSESLSLFQAQIFKLLGNQKKQKEILMNLVNKYPESYLGHKMMAEIYEKEGGMRKAIDEYVKVIEIDSSDYKTYYKISFLLNELDKKDESVIMLKNLLKVKPDHFEAMQLLGDVLCDQGNYKEALNAYSDMLKYYPNSYEAYYNMGMAYTLLTDFSNAKLCYEKAAEINTLLYNAYYSLAQINLIYGDLDDAELYFQKSLMEKETEASAYYNLAKISMIKGNKDKALQYINVAIEMDSKYSKIAEAEPVFIPIKASITFNVESSNNIEKTKLKPNEIKVQEYLDETYKISGAISKNDINLARVSKKDLEASRKEQKQIEQEKSKTKEIIDSEIEKEV